ncbi:hypothetical protein TMatcc_009206 [Talaromyces marneffei ATCC 18224]|uniref:Copia protein n=1 Tax=Talaromyces marneffei PM1 TaxID=1077442 RepID=A0A093UR47_TALMA|nr:hypothetical protein EYB25_007344 [Talaromyces marneffei]
MYDICPYVNPEKRPPGWKPDPEIQKKFDELRKKKNHPKAEKLRWIEKILKAANASSTKASNSEDTKKNGAKEEQANLVFDSDEFCGSVIDTVMSAAASTGDLKHEFVLDSGATVHITNDRSNLTNMGTQTRVLLVGNDKIVVHGPGEMRIFPTAPTNSMVKEKGIRILEAWFVEGMHTNIISLSKLRKHGIVYDGLNECLWSKERSQRLCNIKCDGSLFFIEWGRKRAANKKLENELALSSFEKKTLKDTAQAWHKRLGHLAIEAIRKLGQATEGAIVTTNKIMNRNEDGLQEKYEICAMNDNRRPSSFLFMILFVVTIAPSVACPSFRIASIAR